jgi:hypothetical protein
VAVDFECVFDVVAEGFFFVVVVLVCPVAASCRAATDLIVGDTEFEAIKTATTPQTNSTRLRSRIESKLV